MIGNTYEEAFNGFKKQGLYLDEDKDNFVYTKKSKCYCLRHPENKMKYSWNYVKLGRFSCKECKKENGNKNLTLEEKMKIIEDKGFQYVDGDLSKVLNTIHVQCNHNHVFPVVFNKLQKSLETECPFCNNIAPRGYWNKETCQKWIDENNIGYKILDTKIKDSQLRLFIQCDCGHDPYWCFWQHFKDGTRCNKCYYENNNKIDWDVNTAKAVLKQYGYTMIDENEYKSSHIRVDCIDEFGFKYPASVHYITQGRTKFSLWRNNKYAMHNIKRFCELFRPDYEIISKEYLGNKEVHRWKYLGDCLKDNIDREFDLVFTHFVNNNCGHPDLTKSRLEARCKDILQRHNIQFKEQKTFDGCKDKIKLRFDFYFVFREQEYCIETDGNQHDVPVDKYGGLEGLANTQRRDKIKNDYCKNNNIKLIRIKEREFKNMENIIIQELQLKE